MQSIDYLNNLGQIITELELKSIHSILNNMLLPLNDRHLGENEKVLLPKLLIETQGKFQNLIKNPDVLKTAKSIMLDDFYNFNMISTMITVVSTVTNIDEIRNNRKHLPVFYSVYIRIDILLNLHKSLTELFFHEKMPDMDDSLATIEIEIADFQKDGMPLEIVTNVISSAQRVYDAVVEVKKIKNGKLRIAFIESGSDINISLVGADKAIKEFKNMIIEFWNKIKYPKHEKNNKDIDAIMGALKINGVINGQVKSGALTKDDGVRIKRTIFKGLSNIIDNGALLKDLSHDTTAYDNRELLLEKRTVLLLDSPKKTLPPKSAKTEKTDDPPLSITE